MPQHQKLLTPASSFVLTALLGAASLGAAFPAWWADARRADPQSETHATHRLRAGAPETRGSDLRPEARDPQSSAIENPNAGIQNQAAPEPSMSPAASYVKLPPIDAVSPSYPPMHNRPPLLGNALLKLPVGSIRPQGWLREQVDRLANGLTGRLPELSKWCNANDSAWTNPTGEGRWGWEEFPYWLRGYVSLAFVSHNETLVAEAKRLLALVMATQDADGYFGPRANKQKRDLWPNMLILNAVQTLHEATGDPAALEFMTRYFRWQRSLPRQELLPESWQKIRGGDNLESVLWLYNRTGGDWLLELAQRIHERTVRWDRGIASWHGVNITQGFREPASYGVLSGERRWFDAAERNYQQVMLLYGQQPGGMFGADENCRPGYHGPRQGAETCSMVEFIHSFRLLLAQTGETKHADRAEEIAFNSLPAAMTPELRGLHYLTAANGVQLDKANKAPGIENWGTMLSYDPRDYRCCQHNVGIGWPYFCESLWYATRDEGLACAIYAPCELSAKVARGVEARVVVATDYPFDEAVNLTITTAKPVAFPLYLRVPEWCRAPRITIAGRQVDAPRPVQSWLKIEHTWGPQTAVRVELPMTVQLRRWETIGDSVSVRRGPLWYSLKIGERWERYGGDDEWPAQEVFATTPWNYGLVLVPRDAEQLARQALVNVATEDAEAGGAAPDAQARAVQADATSFTVVRRRGALAAQPFTPDAAPIELRAVGRRIDAWELDRLGLIEEVQGSPVRSVASDETITLIPMGCARLRISVFPQIGFGPDAREWTQSPPSRYEASHYCDDIGALADGALPKSSSDHSVPRFTFWNHKGTTEWITCRLDAARAVSSCGVYWFDDTGFGECRVPARWRVLYRDGAEWKEVEGASGYGVKANEFNRVTFTPVKTEQLKLEIELQPNWSAGLLEWEIGEE